MEKGKFFWILAIVCLSTIACETGYEVSNRSEYAALPKQQREEVIEIDKEINELQKEMAEYKRGFRKDAGEAKGEVYGEWRSFSESVETASADQEKANQIRDRIIELQLKKSRILENHPPQK